MHKPLYCDNKLLELDLHEKTYIVTGASSGIGFETAKQLVKQGATVIMACRNLDSAKKCMESIRKKYPNAKIEVKYLELGDIKKIHDFVDDLKNTHNVLHGLINNAGLMNTPFKKTINGYELQFGVNYLGHFLLTELLIDILKKSAPSRIVCVSSCAHDMAEGRIGNIFFDDINYEKRKYDGWEAYAQSKLANLLHAKSLAKRLYKTGISAVSVHPGWVHTKLLRSTSILRWRDNIFRPLLNYAGMLQPWEGIQTTLHALLDEEVPLHTGSYYSQTGFYRNKQCNQGGWPLESPNPIAQDEKIAEKLLILSRDLVGLT